MWQRNNGQIEEELQIRFTGYLIQAVKRTRRDYLNTLNQYSNSEILTDTTYTTGQTLEQEVTEHLPLRRIHAFSRQPFLIKFYEKLAFSHDLIGQDITAVISAMKFFFILTDIQ